MGALERQILLDSPVGYWPLDDASGSPRDIIGGRSLTMSNTGNVAYRQGGLPTGPSLALTSNASTSGFGTFSGSVPTAVQDNWCVECLVRPNVASGLACLLIYNGDSGANGYGTYLDNSTIKTLMGGIVIGNHGAITLTNGVLYHLISQRVAGSTSLWVNGAQVGSTLSNTPAAPSTRVSLSNAVNGFGGVIGHAAIYAGTLSAARVKAHYEAAVRGGVTV